MSEEIIENEYVELDDYEIAQKKLRQMIKEANKKQKKVKNDLTKKPN
jgi:hypothetical protein